MDYVKKLQCRPNNSCCIIIYSQWFGCDAPSCVLSKLFRYAVPLLDLIMSDNGGINSDYQAKSMTIVCDENSYDDNAKEQ